MYGLIAIVTLIICSITVLFIVIGGKSTGNDEKEHNDDKKTEVTGEQKADMTIIVYMIGSNLESESGLSRDRFIISNSNIIY